MIRVYCKPIATSTEDFMKKITINKDPNTRPSFLIDDYRSQLRLGAFEVQLCKKIQGEIVPTLLHSKLQTRFWPNINVILNRIGKYVKHTKIQVKVYSTTAEESMKGVKVALTCNTEKLDEILHSFNDSLYKIDEKYKSRAYLIREHNKRLNQSFVQKSSQTFDEEKVEQQQNFKVRPTSAVTNRSFNSLTGL